MGKLFGQEYEQEKKQAIKALQAASKFDSETQQVNEDKTMILEPEYPADSQARKKREGIGITIARKATLLQKSSKGITFPVNGKMLLSGTLLLGLVCLLLFLFTGDKDFPDPENSEAVSNQQNSREKVFQGTKEPSIREQVISAQSESEKEQRKMVDDLAQRAENALALGNLTLPEGGSALYYYKEIEQVAPRDHRVKDGYRRIAERYAERAEREINSRQFIEAMTLVENGLAVFPESGRLRGLRTRLESERKQVIEDFAAKADTCLMDNRLKTPYNDSALKYYREIEKIDAGNVLVQEGYRKIGAAYARLADRAFRELDLDSSRHYVSEGLEVDPDNWELQLLERELTKSKPEIFFKSMEKNLKKLF